MLDSGNISIVQESAFELRARAGAALFSPLLDPDVVLRTDGGGKGPLARPPVSGVANVGAFLRSGATTFAPLGRKAIVNGGPGVIVGAPGNVNAVVGMTIVGGRIREIDIVGDPAKLGRLAVVQD